MPEPSSQAPSASASSQRARGESNQARRSVAEYEDAKRQNQAEISDGQESTADVLAEAERLAPVQDVYEGSSVRPVIRRGPGPRPG